MVNDRPALVISFKPKAAGLAVKKIEDRMLNKLAGTIWVDEQEYEIIQADLHLSEKVSLWGGVLGVLDKLNFYVVRRRVEDGVWFNQASTVLIEGRKLFDALRLRTKEEASGFKKVGL